MRAIFSDFDICYADGMGAALASFLLCGERIKKVTANEFTETLCEQAALMGLTIGVVGAEPSVIQMAVSRLIEAVPGLQVPVVSHGFLFPDEEEDLRQQLASARPHLVFVGMGQPTQERWLARIRHCCPQTVFLCVGGLFDYIEGRKPTPPPMLRRAGLEWLYLLIRRPRRFWLRYIWGLPMLAIYILRAYWNRLLHFHHPHSPPGA